MSTTDISVADVEGWLRSVHDDISTGLETLDGSGRFRADAWERPGGGGGESRVMEGGTLFEKAGINFSLVHGKTLPPSATANRPELAGAGFTAMGVSMVLHPDNPYVPTTHANWRFFIARPDGRDPVWWFGGGFDLTPYYGYLEDVIHWHTTARAACEPWGEDLYPRFKKWCDEYFFLRHRNETRGVGGLFYDDFNDGGFERAFGFSQSVASSFLPAYEPIVHRRRQMSFGEAEKTFQRYRRGRYVEFNLVYDRGTLFGLQSGGRTESILMSLPPEVTWRYDWSPEAGTAEAELYDEFLRPRDWLGTERA